jgi:acetyl esterase/lipase
LGNATDPSAGADAAQVIPRMAEFMDSVITSSGGPDHVSVIGDSAGGNIALATAEYVVRRNNDEHHVDDLALPGHIVLFSPALDLTYTDPNFQIAWDPWLALSSSKEHGKIWAGHLPLDSPLVSPLFGSLDGLPPITVFGGSIDLHAVTYLTFQDQVLAHNADPANANDQWDVTFELRRDLMHDWFIFPFLPDAIAIRPDVYTGLGLTARQRTGGGVAQSAGQ